MGKKYIIELEDKPFHKGNGDFLYRVKGFNSLVFDMTGVGKLTPYTEPDFEQVRKEAYDKGYDDATEEIGSDEQAIADKAYQKGLEDAWDAARKIWEYDLDTLKEIFGKAFMRMDIYKLFTASKAIEKIRQYEQEKEEYHIGDEVIRHYKNEFMEGDDTPSIFLSEEDGYFRCLAFNGRSIMIAEYPKNQYRKTGRHFSEIAAVLEKMRESE